MIEQPVNGFHPNVLAPFKSVMGNGRILPDNKDGDWTEIIARHCPVAPGQHEAGQSSRYSLVQERPVSAGHRAVMGENTGRIH